MDFVHLTRKQRVPFGDLSGAEHAPRLWGLLRWAFPAVLAVVLMPDHLHLFALVASVAETAHRFHHLLRGFSCGLGAGLWFPPGEPEIVRGQKHVERMIRYIALNPCRDGLVPDPLSWLFSTYRDWSGAVADPWVTRADISPVVHHRYGVPEAFHRYVSSDPSVCVTGTPMPQPAPPQAIPERAIREIQLATAAALRTHPDQVRRRGHARHLFLALARHQGWTQNRILAETCGMTRRSARRSRLDLPSQFLSTASLCLGDDRLTRTTPPLPSLQPPAERPEIGRSMRPRLTGFFHRPDFGRF
jgi:hypothetical protein